MSISDIKGQDIPLDWIQRGLQSGRLAHAYIFCGPDGVGKALTAKEFAKLILCHDPQKLATGRADTLESWQDGCGQCKSCKLIDAGTHPDYHLIYKELITLIPGKERHKATEIAIDVIRKGVIEKVGLSPVLGEAKVFVVLEAHRLSRSAQNALLKTLEEPPPGTYIILITDRLSSLLPTIRSRAQIVRFSLLNEDFVRDRLANAGANERDQRFFAKLAPGQLGLALELYELGVYDLNDRLASDLAALELAAASDLAQWAVDQAKQLAEKMQKRASEQELAAGPSENELNRAALRRILALTVGFYHDALRRKLGFDDSWLINVSQVDVINELSQKFTTEQLQQKIDCVRQAQEYLDGNVNQGLLLSGLFARLASQE